MSSSYGTLFRVTTWGESHGPAIGVVVDGCPAGIEIDLKEIQSDLDLRRPGKSLLTTLRNESDQVEFLSGVFEGRTTGTPISMIIRNEDQRSHDYGNIAQLYRPGHADLAYDLKYGFRDYRGGGRSSARETATRVAAGSIARMILRQFCGTEIVAYLTHVDGITPAPSDPLSVTRDALRDLAVRCPDPATAEAISAAVLEARSSQNSLGGVIQLVVTQPPVAVGEPVFDRVEAELAKAMLSIPASKGFEIGEGFGAAAMRGSEHNDQIIYENGRFGTRTNHAGGSYGGITIGEPILCKIAFKPTATISQEQKTVDRSGVETTIAAKGRHDPCVAMRAPVIVESMAALVLVDLYLRHRARQF